jgi:RNA polymerase-interacting CarD/CdnL/TRCF family regulator
MATRALAKNRAFKVDDPVVYTACGIGKITALVTKNFQNQPDKQYYEVVIDRSTVWVAVDSGPTSGLRLLTLKSDLARYRDILRSRPTKLTPDARQRKTEVAERLKAGSFQATCEVVRDLTALSWVKALNEADSIVLRKSRDGLYQEWAAAEGVPLAQAVEEVNALLLENRAAHAA